MEYLLYVRISCNCSTHSIHILVYPTRIYDNVIERPDVRNPNLYLPKNRFAKEDICAPSRTNCNFTHDMFTQESIKYLRDRATKQEPFFLFLSYSTPHVGAWRPSESILRYRDKLHMVAPESTCPDDILVPSTSNRIEECRHKTAVEDYLDRDLGTILDLLEDYSLSSNTLVAFAADNGPDFNLKLDGLDIHTRIFKSAGNRVGQKRDLYEGGILTPFVLQWPGKIQPQTMYSQLASLTDLFMTFIKVSKSDALLKHPEVIDGISLLPLLAGESQCGSLDCCSFSEGKLVHDFLFWEYCDQQVKNWEKIKTAPERFCSRAVQTEEGYKLVYNHHSSGYELFQVDPSRNFMIDETKPLRGSHPQVAPLKRLLETSRISLKDSGYKGLKVISEHIFTPFPTTSSPTDEPTRNPTTLSPTRDPTTLSPTSFPTTAAPSSFPTFKPTSQPTLDPTFEPTFEPVTDPTSSPTPRPSAVPTKDPTTAAPSRGPTSMPTPATNAPSQSPVVPTFEPTAFDLSRSRCEEQSQILIKTQVMTDADCMDFCREEGDCKFLSFSKECSCCLLYRACDSPRYESSGAFNDWVTAAVVYTPQPTPEPTLSPVPNITGTLGRNGFVENGVLGIAAILTTLLIVFGLIACIVLAKFNRRERVGKEDEFSRSDSSEGSTDDSFQTA